MKRLLIALLLVAAAVARADVSDPRFLIESITIEGARYSSPRILVAESRLTEGGSYSEDELRDAMFRIKRLPFVLHTDFRLAKGTERGRYVLIIAIEETKPLFVRIDSIHQALQTDEIDQPFDPRNPTTHEVIDHFTNDYYTLGARWFVGAKGVATFATDRADCHLDRDLCSSRKPGYSLGFTQYDLFGTRASIAAVVLYREQSYDLPDFIPATGRRTSSFGDHLTYQLTGALPLFGNNAVRATWSRQVEIAAGANRHYYDQGELAWLYDTTDDPLLPTRGTVGQAALESRRIFVYLPANAGQIPPIRREWQHDFDGRITKYWQLTDAQSVSTGAELQSVGGNGYAEYTLHAGYAAMLIPRAPALKYGDLRFELGYDRFIDHLHAGTSHVTQSRGLGSAGLAYRNAWGVAHLTFQYLGWRHSSR